MSRRLTDTGRIRSGVFRQSQDSIDVVVPPMIDAAYEMSIGEKWENVFDDAGAAFSYIASVGVPGEPRKCLVPESWSDAKIARFLGGPIIDGKFRKNCVVLTCKTRIPVFLSRPDFVGLYTQFLDGKSSILLHNVRQGMAFVRVAAPQKARKRPARKSSANGSGGRVR